MKISLKSKYTQPTNYLWTTSEVINLPDSRWMNFFFFKDLKIYPEGRPLTRRCNLTLRWEESVFLQQYDHWEIPDVYDLNERTIHQNSEDIDKQ